MAKTWSPQQEQIFTWFSTGTGNLVVRARAGTGKTTTILEGVQRAPESTILLAAFNKRIADELTARVTNPAVTAKTLHSVGFGLIRANWTRVKVDDDRGLRLAKAAHEAVRPRQPVPDVIAARVAKLAGLGKNMSPFAKPDDLVEIAYAFDCLPENGWAERYAVEDLAAMAYRAMHMATARDGAIDFDDMVYLPVVCGWTRPTYGLVVIDEAQDMNATQLALAQAVARGRIAVVGDDRQALYAFRGADAAALDRLKDALAAAELPLNVSYRCPQVVATLAASLVPDFSAAPGAPAGEMRRQAEEQMLAEAVPGDYILSRTNAPLARLCLALYRDGRRARIEGRDLAKGLVTLVRRAKARSIPSLIEWLGIWQEREIEKLRGATTKGAQARLEFVADQVETLAALCEGLDAIDDLIARVEMLFGPEAGPAIVLSSVHRAKGLEADRVYVLADTLYCGGKRQTLEEENIHYVAVTRAKRTLVLVTAKPLDAVALPALPSCLCGTAPCARLSTEPLPAGVPAAVVAPIAGAAIA